MTHKNNKQIMWKIQKGEKNLAYYQIYYNDYPCIKKKLAVKFKYVVKRKVEMQKTIYIKKLLIRLNFLVLFLNVYTFAI